MTVNATQPDNRRLYALLAILFAIALTSQVTLTVDALRDLKIGRAHV